MRFELTGEIAAVTFVFVYAPMEPNPNTELKYILEGAGALDLTDSNEGMTIRTGRRKRGDWEESGRVLLV